MDQADALCLLAALGHPTRLDVFRVLVRHEPDGLATGAIVDALGLSQSTVSTHLAVLAKAGAMVSERSGRQIIQRANIPALRDLMLFLARDCCQGHPVVCEPLIAELTC